MKRNSLTAAKVRNAGPGRYSDGNGLILIVWPSGSRNWIQRITIRGKRCDLGLGGYPDTTLVVARDKVAENRRLVKAGVDPRTVTPLTPFSEVDLLSKTSDKRVEEREELVSALLKRDGMMCQGCLRIFDHPRYLEADHLLPRSEGGTDELHNRVLLCGPCNRKKGNRLTLTGLRIQNRKDKFMAHQGRAGSRPNRHTQGRRL